MKIINSLITILVLLVGIYGIAYTVKNDLVENLLAKDETAGEGADDEIAGEAEEDRIHIVDGFKAIEIDDDLLDTVGLLSERLSILHLQPEFTAYAEVIDISSLVALKSRFVDMQAEKRILQNELQNLQVNLKRAIALHEAKSLSAGELVRHQADVDHKRVELNALATHIENLKFKIKSDWGDVIGQIILDPDKESEFNRLAMHESYLVKVSLPRGRTITGINQDVYLNNTLQRENAVPATYVDKSRLAGNPLYGESYIYLLESGNLWPGMRLYAWIKENTEALSGLFVPDEAVVWYANDPWVYIQYETNIFVRKPLTNTRKVENGWLVTDGIGESDMVVISGGQTLLSEEFKWAIPDEDDD